jgi:hypothetical protein
VSAADEMYASSVSKVDQYMTHLRIVLDSMVGAVRQQRPGRDRSVEFAYSVLLFRQWRDNPANRDTLIKLLSLAITQLADREPESFDIV